MLPDYRLCPVDEEDFLFYKQCHHETMRSYVEAIWGWDSADQERRVRESFHSFQPGEVQIIQVRDKDIGIFSLERKEGDLFITQLWILPGGQGLGVGTAIIRNVITEAKNKGLGVSLRVLRGNDRAKALYERLEFIVYSEDESGFFLRHQGKKLLKCTVRPAEIRDSTGIIDAHMASIKELGPEKYDPAVVSGWAYPRSIGKVQSDIEDEKNHMFVAALQEDKNYILGFSNYRYDEKTKTHRIGLYVRGRAARQGVGCALFRVAEQCAVRAGVKEIHSASSLVAENFYRAMGYEVLGKGVHTFDNGIKIEIVNMKKVL